MKSKVKTYIDNLTQDVKASIQKDYDLIDYDFKSFDYINFYLINNFILKEGHEDLFIGIPEDEYRESFFESILYSVSLIKYFQNYCGQEEQLHTYVGGDLILTKRDIYKFICFIGKKIKATKLFPSKDEKNAVWEIERLKYPVLLKNFKYQPRVSAELLYGYRDFYKAKLRDQNIEFLTSFKSKVLIISSKQISDINPYIPFCYRSKSGNERHGLPIEVMIEICNDFKTAKKHLLDKGHKFDELIIIGDTKYDKEEDFSEILKAKNLGLVKNLILIGSAKPTTTHSFLTWDWSNEEVKIANNEPLVTFKKDEIDFPELTSLTLELFAKIEEYRQTVQVNLSSCLKFCNFYFKLPLSTDAKGSAIIDDYFQRLSFHFASEEFEKIFHDADIYEPDRINSIRKEILSFFEKFGFLLKSKNPKLEYLIANSKADSQNVIIVDKHFVLNLETYFKQQGINKTKIISERKNTESKHYLENWIKNDSLNTTEKSYLIPYAVNIEQFKTLLNLKGHIIFLTYTDLDSLRFTRINEYLINESENKLSHKDREKFSKIKYQNTDPTAEHTFDSLFFANGNDAKEIVEEEKLLEDYRDEIEYKITFTDNTPLVAKSSKAVFLIDGNEQIKIKIGDVYEGATIRFYRNETPEDFERTLKHFDKDGLLSRIAKYSQSWKDALQTLKKHFGNESILLRKLHDKKLRIAEITFSNYFKRDNETHFPRTETLKKIKELCIESVFHNLLFVAEFNEVMKCRAKDKEIRQSAGRLLSNDLLDWVATGEKSENLKSIPEDILNNIKSSVQQKTIRTKKNIERNEVRLQTELPFNF